MKKILAFLVALTLLLTTACSGNNPAGPQENPQGAAPELKDTIIFAQPADAPSLDPQIGKQLRASTVMQNMFETLVTCDDDYNFVPGLAESWEWKSDTRLEFKIKSGVKFHNGETMTVDDVKYSIERAVNSTYVGYYVTFIKSVEIVDDRTVAVELNNPYGATLNVFAALVTSIVPKSVASADEEGFALHPVGTGPYKFVEWKQSEYVKMEAFDGYRDGVAPTKYIIMKVVPESAQREVMLETGEIDLAYEFAPSDVAKLEAFPELQLFTTPSTKAVVMDINMRKSSGPLASKQVRQAIERLIDKQSIVDNVIAGHGTPVANLVTPTVFGYDGSLKADKYNVDEAKALLKQAGYADGFNIKIWSYNEQIYLEICQVIQSQLAEAGIKAEIETMEYSTMSARMAGGEDYDLCIDFFNSTTGDAGHTLYGQFHSQAGDSSSWCRFNNPEADKYIMAGRESNDNAARAEAYKKLFRILEDEVPQFGIYAENVLVGASKKVEGFKVTRDGYHDLRKAKAYK